jgi:cyclophilin family peptidyl-prolyl cis-trans isomerase
MPTDKRLRQKEREQAARAARAAQAARAKRRRTIITVAIALVAVFGFAFLYSTIQGGDDVDDVATDTTFPPETEMPATTGNDTAAPPEPGSAECPPEDGSAERQIDFDGPPQFCLEEGATYEAVFETDAGDIRVALDTERTPNTVNNFVFLARYGYYDGTDMFRSNTGIDIIQGGAPHTQDNRDPGPGYTIQDEGGTFNYSPGDLVMARTLAPNSASAQYFFSTGPNTAVLNPQGTYVVFGRVVEGLDVLEAIMETHVDDPTAPTEGEGAPDPKPVVNTVRIIQT